MDLLALRSLHEVKPTDCTTDEECQLMYNHYCQDMTENYII